MKKLSLLLIALLALTAVEARSIGEQEARQKASQLFGNLGQKRMTKRIVQSPRKTPELAVAVSRNEFYVFNDEANGGFVIVSGEDRMPGVLGYSYDGHFDADNIPCNLQALLEDYADQVKYLREHPEVQSAPHQAPVNDYISPLLNCHWDVLDPYNRKCPTIGGQHALTGQMATAMAQVMYYYKWPEVTSQTIPGYTTKTSQITVSEQRVTRIDWPNILPDYKKNQYSSAEADAVAKLMVLCGTALQADYGLYGSAATMTNQAFEDYFDYFGGVEVSKSNYDYQDWCQILYEELKGGHPVLYNGTNIGTGYHQFVLDGYDVNNNGGVAEAYFHLNFGWSGSMDAYYSLNNVVGYNSFQYARIGLRPNSEIFLGKERPYAVLEEGKVTFFYDTKKAERSGQFFFLGLPWDKQEITECEFDASFADYKMTNCNNLFKDCRKLESIKGLKNLNTEYVTDMSNMFSGCSRLTSLDVNGFKTDNVTNMESLFHGCSRLTSLDVNGWNTGKVTNMNEMFYGCSGLTSLDVSGFKTDNVTDMESLFHGCSSLTSLDVSDWDTGKVTNMNSLFNGCSSLTSLDVSGWDTGKVTNMNSLFNSCANLTNLDVSGFKTENVTNMESLFYGCYGLTNLDLSGWNMDNVTTMSNMFYCCYNLTSLDVNNWNTDNVTDMNSMFYGCASLTSLDVSGLNTENVTEMGWMFYSCYNLTSLDISGFNTGNLVDMTGMFGNCPNLKSLDLSGFNTSNVTSMMGMFYRCSGLTTIYASNEWNTEKITYGNSMFSGCTNLVGGKGTTFDKDHTDHGYARIDGGPEAPGYLTDKGTSDIKNILTNKDKEKSIYSIDGKYLLSPQKGVNIIDGKKVVVR